MRIAVILEGLLLQDLFVEIDDAAVRAVADGMSGDLEAVLARLRIALVQGVVGHPLHALLAGLVAVGLEQQGAAGAQGAVGVELDAAHGQAVAVQADLGPFLVVDFRVFPFIDHVVDPDLELALLVEFLHEVGFEDARERAGGAGGHDRGDPEGEHLVLGLQHGFLQPVIGHGRDLAADEIPRRLVEDSRGVAVGVLVDGAAGGVRGVLVDSRHGERLRVDPDGMAAGAGQHDGMIRRYRVQLFLRGELLVGPHFLVPAAADDPGPCGQFLGLGLHLGQDFRLGRPENVYLEHLLALSRVVHVPFDQTGQDRLSLEIDDLRLLAHVGLGALVVAHVDQLLAGDGHGRGLGLFVVHGVYVAVEIDRVGGLRR